MTQANPLNLAWMVSFADPSTVSATSEATICISQHMETQSRTGRLHELDHKDSIARSKPNQKEGNPLCGKIQFEETLLFFNSN